MALLGLVSSVQDDARERHRIPMVGEVDAHTVLSRADKAVQTPCHTALQEAVSYDAFFGLVCHHRGVPGMHPWNVPNGQPPRLPCAQLGKAYAYGVYAMG